MIDRLEQRLSAPLSVSTTAAVLAVSLLIDWLIGFFEVYDDYSMGRLDKYLCAACDIGKQLLAFTDCTSRICIFLFTNQLVTYSGHVSTLLGSLGSSNVPSRWDLGGMPAHPVDRPISPLVGSLAKNFDYEYRELIDWLIKRFIFQVTPNMPLTTIFADQRALGIPCDEDGSHLGAFYWLIDWLFYSGAILLRVRDTPLRGVRSSLAR